MKRILKQIILTLITMLLLVNKGFAGSADNSRFDWMNNDLFGLANLFSTCIERPTLGGIVDSKKTLNLDQAGQWTPTGVLVTKDRLLKFEWDTRGVVPNPRKYLVLYRIDPRFEGPQIFIQTYDYDQKKYLSDFHSYLNGQLLRYQLRPEIDFPNRVKDFTDYFNFVNREKIKVNSGDVVNISLEKGEEFFRADAEFNLEYDPNNIFQLELMYTTTPTADNNLIFINSTNWCSALSIAPGLCAGGLYNNSLAPASSLTGALYEPNLNAIYLSISKCSDATSGMNNPLCLYDKGRGLHISLGGTTIKDDYTKFVTSNITNKDFIHYKSEVTGDLEFSSGFKVDQMFNGIIQYMKDWNFATDDLFKTYLSSLTNPYTLNYIHVGRYVMNVEIGNGSYVIGPEDEKAIKVFYYVQPNGSSVVPDSSTNGMEAGRNFSTNAPETGYLWLKVVKPNSTIGGTIVVKQANYTGSTWFSDVVYNDLVKPLRDKYNQLTVLIYTKLITNATLQNIARSALVLYVIFFGLMFLSGATKITVTEIVTRVMKIALIVALFSPTSWNFFNQNLFQVFVSGSDYLLGTVVGVTSSVGNIFGFIDPIFDKYTNTQFWSLLAIQLLQFQNGLAFLAIMTLYGLMIYFRAVLEVIISYCLAFLGLAVLISLAPFFITCILFERTKSLFDNWLSNLFYYMMQPTILLVFFLLIDQLMADQITNTVVRACWDILIPLKFGLGLDHMGIPLRFSFQLSFFPGFPFFVSQVQGIDTAATLFSKDGTFLMVITSSLLFFAYCKLAAGLIDYVNLIVQSMTNVLAARAEGRLHGTTSPAGSVIDDMQRLASPVTSPLKSLGSLIKKKVVDQKFSTRGGSGGSGGVGDPDYSKINRSIDGDIKEDSIESAKNDLVTAKPKWQSAVPNKDSTSQSAIKIGANRSGGGATKEEKDSNNWNATPSDDGSKKAKFSMGGHRNPLEKVKEDIEDTKENLEQTKAEIRDGIKDPQNAEPTDEDQDKNLSDKKEGEVFAQEQSSKSIENSSEAQEKLDESKNTEDIKTKEDISGKEENDPGMSKTEKPENKPGGDNA